MLQVPVACTRCCMYDAINVSESTSAKIREGWSKEREVVGSLFTMKVSFLSRLTVTCNLTVDEWLSAELRQMIEPNLHKKIQNFR